MYNLNQNLHFVGIGGVGMAGIAEVLLNLGYKIAGSDLRRSVVTENLEALGASIRYGHAAENVSKDTDVVVASSAVQSDNVELVRARELGVPIIPRAEMLSELMRLRYGICIAGSHGKTTTTSMTATILSEAGLDPTVIIGGRVLSKKSGARVGTGPYMVVEADESDGSFALLRPVIAVVTNIDAEHLSYFKTFGALEEAFFKFMSTVPFYGLVVLCVDDPVIARLSRSLERRVVRYGVSPEAEIRATDIRVAKNHSRAVVTRHGELLGELSLPVPGMHLVKNALAAIAVGLELGVYGEEALVSLASFSGVQRRSEVIGSKHGVTVIDDYGHHPTEIRETLQALRAGWIEGSSSARLHVLFQPHRYSRTRELFGEFLGAFSAADAVYMSDIYPAGEKPIEGVTAEKLCGALQHENAHYIGNHEEFIPKLVRELCSGDLIVTLGAGSIGGSARKILSALEV